MMVVNTDMVNSLSDGVSDVGGDGRAGAVALDDAPRNFGAIAQHAEQKRRHEHVKTSKNFASECFV
jgi:hypothetical protein